MTKTTSPKLTKTKATSQAGSIFRRNLPGELVFVESAGSWDLATDTHLMVTTVTHPEHFGSSNAAIEAKHRLSGVRSIESRATYTKIVREV